MKAGHRLRARAAAAVLFSVLMAAGTIPASEAAGAAALNRAGTVTPVTADERMTADIDAWVQALSREKPFLAWAGAAAEVSPLGPGTHSWYVTLTKEGRTVGYLILSADESGERRLVEYGTSAMFGPAILRRAADAYGFKASQAQPLYANPYLAAWRIRSGERTLFLDAASGDAVSSLNEAGWQAALAQAAKPPAALAGGIAGQSADSGPPAIRAAGYVPPFDPYERLPWLTKKPLPSEAYADDLPARLAQGEQLRLTAQPFGSGYLAVWSAAGFHRWSDGGLAVGFCQENGMRFIALDFVRAYGSFYR